MDKCGSRVLLRDPLPFVGARPERAHQWPGLRMLCQGHRFPLGHGEAGAPDRGPAEPPLPQGAGLPHAVGGLPRGAVPVLTGCSRKTGDVPAASGLRRHSPAKPAAGFPLPYGAVYDAGKSRLSPFRVRANASRPRFLPLSVHEGYALMDRQGQCYTSEWNWGVD